jgi:pSer/pThr/pTyr-binding forkhead associated (FHA) protein
LNFCYDRCFSGGTAVLKCSKCGYKNTDDARICNLCSNKLDPSTSVLTSSGPGGAKKAPSADHFMFEPRMLGGGVNRRTANLGSTPAADRHFLIPPTGEPARIEPGTTYLVGREESAQIRVQAPRVSRRHAEIKFDGGKPAVHDLGSQNGTIVNGMKLSSNASRVLQDKDVIDIGGITMTYRFLKAGEPESKLKDTGGDATMVGGDNEEQADLTGNVALMPIGDVLNRLESLQATGLLVIEAGGAKGAIRIEGGKAVAGSYAGLENDGAIAAVRSLAQGKFRFEMQDADAPVAEVIVPEPKKAPPPKAPPKPGPPPKK